ncbi:helix-turn-helix transcriptional regulator [Brevibacterium casei]|uniref:Regulatory protein, luxR family n=1 Tax=Brevibacterium casei CIP 102111 TaxID=1255625 RepID=A0A2H1JEG7_9MICO|nr:LuxR C-terminal-related transcriptional regulator [Brevibacterium casei]MCT1448340.1 LuxR C-terminal-related transcriptional regulator [Brevibacterium casei]QPR39045.1 response regulator transcription factor [Brevibacterium casei]QPR43211.1 response regulator transcription factor [Brevibacterium casei]SMX85839.1 regulatory protein, luxR family [Brevibacterium casei CIP 102111]
MGATLATPGSERIRRSLDRIRSATGADLAFGGEVTGDRGLRLAHFFGHTVGALPGVTLHYDAGLGGRAVALRRPLALNDYVTSDAISHHYDEVITAERLRGIAAAPVVIDRETTVVLYAAFRTDTGIADRLLSLLTDEARDLEHALITADDEIDDTAEAARALLSRVRLVHGELRTLSAGVHDRRLQRELRAIADSLTATEESGNRGVVGLTDRETDVLALAATGLTNQEIGDRLGLTLLTVKAYMKAIMAKLNARTRFAAVVEAQKAGLLP